VDGFDDHPFLVGAAERLSFDEPAFHPVAGHSVAVLAGAAAAVAQFHQYR
jgi:hypothetical protein